MKRFLLILLAVCMVLMPVSSTYVMAAEFPHTEDPLEETGFTLAECYVLVPEGSNLVVTNTAEYRGTGTGMAALQEWNEDWNANQKWHIMPSGSSRYTDSYKIISYMDYKCFNITNSSRQEGTLVQASDYYTSNNQVFTLEMTDDGYFTIQNPESKMYLGALTEGDTQNVAIFAEPQKWSIYKVNVENAERLVVPQIGWEPKAAKRAVYVSNTEIDPPTFTVTKDGQEVLSGTMVAPEIDVYNQYPYYADLSSLQETGDYTISVSLEGVEPADFFIKEGVYQAIYGRNPQNLSEETYTTIADITNTFYRWQRCDENDMLPIEEYERGKNPGDGVFFGDEYDLPIYEMPNEPAESGSESTPVATGETWPDASGGYVDATSTDKETGDIAKAMESLLLAYEYATDETDRAEVLEEIIWGCDYLVKIQKDNGAYILAVKPEDWWVQDSLHRNVRFLDGADLACRVAAALAGAAKTLEDIDPERSATYRASAEKAWAYYEENPTNFINPQAYPTSWIGNAGSIMSAAASLYALTGEQKYADYINQQMDECMFLSGVWVGMDFDVPGQMSNYIDEVQHGQVVEALCKYYKYCDPSVRDTVKMHLDTWSSFWKVKSQSAYGIDVSILKPWFGGCGWMMQIGEKMLTVALTLNDLECLNIGSAMFDFVTGMNPMGASFIVGCGDTLGCEPFARAYQDTIGVALPGLFVDETTGNLTSRTGEPSICWKAGETGIDVGSATVATRALLNYAFTEQYEDIASGAEGKSLADTVPVVSTPEESTVSDTDSSAAEPEASAPADSDASSVSPVIWVVVVVIAVVVIAGIVLLVLKKKTAKK